MHHQRANTYNCTNAATRTHGHGRAVTDRHNRADQHTGANGHSDDYSHSYSNCNSVPHANTVADSHHDTNADTNTNGHIDSDTYSHAVAHGHTDSDPDSRCDINASSNGHPDSNSDANAYPGTHSDTYTVADTNGDSRTAAKHRRAARCPRGILRRDQRRQLDEQRRLALRPATGPMARSLCRLTRQRHRTPARPKQPLRANPS